MNYKSLFYPLLFAAILFAVASCENKSTSSGKEKITEPAIQVSLPVLPEEEIARLANESTVIDFIFHDSPVSINFNDRSSIVQMCNFLSHQKPVKKARCHPIAIGIFTSGADELRKADLYFDENCAYFAFYKTDGKGYEYENQLNAQGIQYFTKVVESTKSARPQQ